MALLASGLSRKEIAELMGVTHSSITKIIWRRNPIRKYLRRNQWDAVLPLLTQGMGRRKIAETMGLSYASIQKMIWRHRGKCLK